jgi:hypothetical protein
MAQAVWILPTQLSGNPGWLRPLRTLLSRVDILTLFHALDRSEGAPEPSPRADTPPAAGPQENEFATAALGHLYR